jgi:archaellum component FlaC
MKTELEIKNKINDLQLEIDELHLDRNELAKKNGGVTDEYNKDFFMDISSLSEQIKALEWVLTN